MHITNKTEEHRDMFHIMEVNFKWQSIENLAEHLTRERL